MSVIARLDGADVPLTYIPGTKTTPPHYHPSKHLPLYPTYFKPLIRLVSNRSHTPYYASSSRTNIDHMSRHTTYTITSLDAMPTRTMTLREQHLQYMAEQDEHSRRHEGERVQRGERDQFGTKDGETMEESKVREAKKNREDKQRRGNTGHRRHRSQRERTAEKDDLHTERRRHSQMYVSDIQSADRKQLSRNWGRVASMPSTHIGADDQSELPLGADCENFRQTPNQADDYLFAQALQAEEHANLRPVTAVAPNRRSVAIDSDVAFFSEPLYPTVSPRQPAHVAPARHSQSFNYDPQYNAHHATKPLPMPPHLSDPHGSAPRDPESQPPYWMETIGHAFWTLGLTLGHILGSFASSIIIFILGSIHCILTSVLIIVAAVSDGISTMLRFLLNLITCQWQSGDWGWDWTHLTKAWQWGRKSAWVWEFVGRVHPETDKREEKIAKRVSLHEARKEDYKREQEEKAMEQGQGQPIAGNKRYGNAALYGRRPMVVDIEKGNGRGPEQGLGNRVSVFTLNSESFLTSTGPLSLAHSAFRDL